MVDVTFSRFCRGIYRVAGQVDGQVQWLAMRPIQDSRFVFTPIALLIANVALSCAQHSGTNAVQDHPVQAATAAADSTADVRPPGALWHWQWWFENNKFPPIVETRRDVEQLPASATSVRARGLSDSDISSLARLRQLRFIDFESGWGVEKANITDEGLARLSRLELPELDNLSLGDCGNITDAGLVYVGQMHTVTTLQLTGNPQLTDAGLQNVLTMKRLTYLDLRGCSGITDRGLLNLANKTDWKTILLTGSQNVTSGGVARLQSALPNAKIIKPEVGSPNYVESPRVTHDR
jgi:hypothetical protein